MERNIGKTRADSLGIFQHSAYVYVCFPCVSFCSAVFHTEISIFSSLWQIYMQFEREVYELFRTAVSPNLSSVRQGLVVIQRGERIRAFFVRICPSRNSSIMETATNLIEISFICRGFKNRQRVKVFFPCSIWHLFIDLIALFKTIFFWNDFPLEFLSFSQIFFCL